MDIEGIVTTFLPQASGTSPRGNWIKQEIIVEQPSQFNKKVCIAFWGDKVNDLSGINVGSKVTISINIESREFNGRWYTEARAWKISSAETQSASPNDNGLPPMDQISAQYTQTQDDDMPF